MKSGDRLGKYLVGEKIGSSQHGDVHLAVHELMGRAVVVKVLSRADESVRALFFEEARQMAALDHPGIVRLLDVDEGDGRPYLVMEQVPGGQSLAKLMAMEVHWEASVAVKLAADVADALHHMHAHGIAHRDVHPGNVVVSSAGRAVLVDLSSATTIGAHIAGEDLRLAGARMYLSPEAWNGAPTDPGMDVWGLAVTLHKLLVGSTPWVSTSVSDLQNEIVAGVSRLGPALPEPLSVVIARCLARDRAVRITDALTLRRELEALGTYLEVGSDNTIAAGPISTPGTILVDVESIEPDLPGRYREYRVHEKLGEGGFGEVYAALDVFGEREVALKFLRAERCHDEATIRRFRREARILSLVIHPNVVRVYNFGTSAGRMFMVMELLRGRDLEATIPPGGFAAEEAIVIGAQILTGLAALHEQGVVHRDVKPANVMLLPTRVVVTDLGIAQIDNDDTKLTTAGHFVGTPRYLAPEQVNGGEITARTDVFATGVVLFHMLTGRPPCVATALPELVYRITSTDAPRVTEFRPDVSAALAAVVSSMLRRDPAERPPDARRALEKLLGAMN